MATIEELIKKAEANETTEVVKEAGVKNDEFAKLASELEKLSPEELQKVAEEVEALETAESIEMMKEADAYGRFVARGYWDRILQVQAESK